MKKLLSLLLTLTLVFTIFTFATAGDGEGEEGGSNNPSVSESTSGSEDDDEEGTSSGTENTPEEDDDNPEKSDNHETSQNDPPATESGATENENSDNQNNTNQETGNQNQGNPENSNQDQGESPAEPVNENKSGSVSNPVSDNKSDTADKTTDTAKDQQVKQSTDTTQSTDNDASKSNSDNDAAATAQTAAENVATAQGKNMTAATGSNTNALSLNSVSTADTNIQLNTSNAVTSAAGNNAVQITPDSNLLGASTGGADIVANLRVENPTTSTLVLAWDAPSGGADGYEITLSKASDFSSPTVRETTNTFYNVTGLICGTTYYYRVRAYILDSGVKEYGEYRETSFMTSPAAPSTFTATQTGATSVKLSWSSVGDSDGYIITFNGNALTTISNKSNTTYTHNDIDTYTNLTYRIYAYKNVSGTQVQGESYKEAKITKMKVPVPTGLKIVSTGKDTVKLTWNAMEGVEYYQIRRKTETEFENVGQSNTNSFMDTGLDFGRDYSYTVTAYVTSSYYSDPCAPVLGRASGSAPTNLQATLSGSGSVKVTWNKVSGANGYKLEGSNTKGSGYSTIYEGSNLAYTETGLALGSTRYYRVSAYANMNSGKLYSGVSDVVYCVVLPIAPSLKVENTDYTKQKVIWNSLGSSVKYEFNLSTDSSFSNPVVRKTSNDYYQVTGCTNGVTYYYRVRGYVELNGGTTVVYGPYSSTVSMLCTPGKTGSVSIASISGNTVKLNWSAVNGATAYRIYARKDAGSWSWIGTAKAPALTYTVTGLTVGSKYYFGVSAARTSDRATTVGSRLNTPEVLININNFTPTGFSDTAVSATSVKVSWKAMSGISTYEVEGKSSDDSSYKLSQTVTTNNITLTGLKKGYDYQIRVRSKITVNNVAQYSPWSAYYTVQPKALGPTTLSLTSAVASYAVSVDWSVVSGADGYIIERSNYKEGPYTVIKDIGDGSAKHYGDYNFSASDVGKTFFYRVCSYFNSGTKQKSAYTGPKQVLLTMPQPTVTARPQNMGRINLSWTNLNADYYQIYRSTSPDSGYSVIATTASTSYSNTGVKFGTIYYYKVRGVKNVSGTTAIGYLSNYVSAEPTIVAPTITSRSANGSSVKVNWSSAAGAQSYNVYYHAEGSGWTKAGNTKNLTYTVTGLTPQTKYYFKVASVATASNGRTIEGLHSAQTSITTVATNVGTVTGVKTSPNGLNSTTVTWTKVTDASGYEVQIATYYPSNSGMGPWHAWTSSTTNKANVNNLISNKTYWIRVRAYVTSGGLKTYGSWSTAIKGYSAPSAPSGVSVKSTAKNSVTVKWNAVSGAAGYRILYGTNKNSLSVYRDVVNPSLSEFTISGLSSGTTYYFQIQPFGVEASTLRLYGTKSTIVNGKTK